MNRPASAIRIDAVDLLGLGGAHRCCTFEHCIFSWRAVRDETPNSWVIAVEFPRKPRAAPVHRTGS
jgi:hypothetical protein